MKLPSWITARPIAHRGLFDAARGIPENSLAAIRAAIDAGYAMELDLQPIAGGIAVFHDFDLARMTGRNGDLRQMTPAALKRFRLSGTGETIPLLEEVLALVRGRVPLMLEIKNKGRAGVFENLILAKLAGYRGEIALVSFNPFSLRWFRRYAPQFVRGQTSCRFTDSAMPGWRKFLQRHFLLNVVSRPDFLLYDLDGLPNAAVSLQRTLGAKLVAYTVRSERRRRESAQPCRQFHFRKDQAVKRLPRHCMRMRGTFFSCRPRMACALSQTLSAMAR